MFTGIIEEIGKIKGISKQNNSIRMDISAKVVLEETRLGDSIAVNGVCLTAVNLTNSAFSVDIAPETLRKTNLGKLTISSRVNLERALKMEQRLNGHLVMGHVDGIARILSKKQDGTAILIDIELPAKLRRYVIEHGSVTVDGISLTVARLGSDRFTISLIPHTTTLTTIATKEIGDIVNLEVDVLGKYIERLLTNSKIDEDFLKKHGF